MISNISSWRVGLVSVAALSLAACGGPATPAATDPAAGEAGAPMAQDGAPVAEAAAVPAAEPGALPLIPSPSWFPADWDQNVYSGADYPNQPPDVKRKQKQFMIFTAPITLWAVAHDTLVDERFEPIWVWYAALRSCEKGIEMSEDLGGEFGNRERGKVSLTQARNELKAWAATQPQELTMYFGAELAQWDEATGNFMMQNLTNATTIRLKDALSIDPYFDGATVELWSDFKVRRQSINHFQASLIAPDCISKDGTMTYKFQKQSQWWVVFGDVDRGAGGLANYKSHELLPAINMTRESAAAFAQRNPQRKVEVAVTFTPAGSSFVKGIDQSAVRNNFKQVTIYDALDGSVLATETY